MIFLLVFTHFFASSDGWSSKEKKVNLKGNSEVIRFHFLQQNEDAPLNGHKEGMNKNIFIHVFHEISLHEDWSSSSFFQFPLLLLTMKGKTIFNYCLTSMKTIINLYFISLSLKPFDANRLTKLMIFLVFWSSEDKPNTQQHII